MRRPKTTAQIDGFTVNHWSVIPIHSESGSGTGDRHKLSLMYQASHMIIKRQAPKRRPLARCARGRLARNLLEPRALLLPRATPPMDDRRAQMALRGLTSNLWKEQELVIENYVAH